MSIVKIVFESNKNKKYIRLSKNLLDCQKFCAFSVIKISKKFGMEIFTRINKLEIFYSLKILNASAHGRQRRRLKCNQATLVIQPLII